MSDKCPSCGHDLMHHAIEAHWSTGPCSRCRRETHAINRNPPRELDECCQLTSGDVRKVLTR